MKCPMDLNSTHLTYNFNALFRDTPFAYLTQRFTRDIYDARDVTYVTYVTHVTYYVKQKVAKWGILEKHIKNVGQWR